MQGHGGCEEPRKSSQVVYIGIWVCRYMFWTDGVGIGLEVGNEERSTRNKSLGGYHAGYMTSRPVLPTIGLIFEFSHKKDK